MYHPELIRHPESCPALVLNADDTPLSYYYRHERAARVYDGPDEVHKQSVAKRILKSYGIKIG